MRIALTTLCSLFVAVASGCGSNKPCSSATCAVGCCDASGRCQTGSFSAACGIGGATCSVCSVTQTCSQGQCVGANTGAGNGAGGGFGGTGGGSAGPQLEVMPASAAVASGDSLTLSGRVVGGIDNGVTFSLAQGGGSLSRTSASTAIFYAASANATVRILATSVQNTSVSRFIDLSINQVDSFSVVPTTPSSNALPLPPGSRQTFSGMRIVSIPNTPSPSSMVAGVNGLQWFVWPSGTIDSTGTLTAATTDERVYAREPSTNLWASADVSVMATNTNAIAITPAVSTVTRGGVVQLTAVVSSGAAVTWRVFSSSSGSVNSTGTYTAPSTAGIYLVQANAGSQYALATIVVQ